MNEYRWNDLTVGMNHRFEAMFTLETARTFSALSGDTNPIHLDREYATSTGFKAEVVFGLLTSSLYSQLVGVHLPGKYALLQGIDIDFHAACYFGDMLLIEGEITFLSEAYRRMEIKASIRKQDQTLVSKATIRAGLHG